MKAPIRTVPLLCTLLMALLVPLAPRALATAPVPAGTYFGLIEGDSYENSGYVRVVLSRGGKGTAAVQLGDEALCVVFIGYDGQTGRIIRLPGGDADMGIDLRIVFPLDGSPIVIGAVTDDGETLEVEAPKTATGPALAAQPSGRFTFELGGASGYGAVKVGRNGAVRGILRLETGETLSLGGALAKDGTWPLFAMAKNGKTISGDVAFAEDGEISGTLHRRTPPTATVAESDSLVSIYGGRFDGTVGFGQADAHGAVAVEVGLYPDDEPPVAFGAAITRTGVFFQREAGLRVLAVRFSPATGFISGRVKTPAGSTFTLFGAVLQDADGASGFLAGGKGYFGIEGGTRSIGGTSSQYSGTSMTLAYGFTAVTSGAGKTGSGTLTLSGANLDAGGDTPITGGTLQITSDTALGTGDLVVNGTATGAILQIGNSGTGTSISGGIADSAGVVSSGATLTKTGSGTLTFGGSNAYTGATTVNAGVLQFDGGVTGGILRAAKSSAFGDSVVILSGNGSVGGQSDAGVALGNGVPLTPSPSLSVDGTTIPLSGAPLLSGGVVMSGVGVQTVTGTNSSTNLILTVHGQISGGGLMQTAFPDNLIIGDGASVGTLGSAAPSTLELSTLRTLSSDAAASLTGGPVITDEDGAAISVDNIQEARFVFVNGQRYFAVRMTAGGALQLIAAPLRLPLIAE